MATDGPTGLSPKAKAAIDVISKHVKPGLREKDWSVTPAEAQALYKMLVGLTGDEYFAVLKSLDATQLGQMTLLGKFVRRAVLDTPSIRQTFLADIYSKMPPVGGVPDADWKKLKDDFRTLETAGAKSQDSGRISDPRTNENVLARFTRNLVRALESIA